MSQLAKNVRCSISNFWKKIHFFVVHACFDCNQNQNDAGAQTKGNYHCE